MAKDYGNCEKCGTALKLAPGIDVFCPKTDCNRDREIMLAGLRQSRDDAERAEYERLKAKFG